MAKILIAWELGGGLGHLVPLLGLAEDLLERGHDVSLAARDLVEAGTLFDGLPITYYQAPHRIEPFQPAFDPPITYGHLLHNIGFGTEGGLYALCSAWKSIFASIRPEVVLFEHSPVAMFAARELGCRKAALGTGFTAPPTPLPLIRPWMSSEQSDWTADHRRTVDTANRVAARLGLGPLATLDDVYAGVTPFLRTYPEIDHFGPRRDGNYVGIALDSTGKKPHWPYGEGPKLFAYLKPFQGFHEAVSQLYQLRMPCIIFCPHLRAQQVRELEEQFPSIVFSTEPLNIELVVRDCNVAICHGGHGMVARMLLAGIPLVAIPLQLEQTLISQRLAASGAGIHLAGEHASKLGSAIRHILSNESYATAGKRMSHRYAEDIPNSSWDRIIAWIEAN